MFILLDRSAQMDLNLTHAKGYRMTEAEEFEDEDELEEDYYEDEEDEDYEEEDEE
jgi:hypothetical protein